VIKGNAQSRLFHTPSSPYYGRTRAEAWFRTAEDAEAAGFRPYRPRRRT
jgi:methylphosphotriester-DNA--protein-cysteine methyltransferase